MSKRPKPEKDFLSSEQVKSLLTSMPKEDLVSLESTLDQVRYWLLHRRTYVLVARVWVAKREGIDDPIAPLVKAGQMSKNDHDRIWALAYFYECLQNVVYWTEPLIRESFAKSGREYPFENRAELFACLLLEQTSGEFSICLDKYREIPGGKNQRQYKSLAGHLRGKPLTESQEKEVGLFVEPTEKGVTAFADKVLYNRKTSKYPWFSEVLSSAKKGATRRNPQLKRDLKNFYEATAELFSKEATHHRIQGSIAWFDGHKVQASEDGTYHKPKP
jgi:hypothetical protein